MSTFSIDVRRGNRSCGARVKGSRVIRCGTVKEIRSSVRAEPAHNY